MNAHSQQVPADRYCDLVLKGGITSGVVYPPAICKLAQEYRFKSIGGTSAGAIAAAVTAAAEYQRRQTGSFAGFELLGRLPDELSKKDGDRTRLLRLFQPQPATRRLFDVLISALNKSDARERVFAVLWGCLHSYWTMSLLAVLVAVIVGSVARSWYVAVTLLIAGLIVFVGRAIYRDLTRALVANDYGMCSGLTVDERDAALTPWLHDLIQRAAGRTSTDRPLTFGELWQAPGFPPSWIELPPEVRARSIDLQMFTTNLTHGRPYVFPHTDGKARLFYASDELAKYMPAEVMRWIDQHARDYVPDPASDPHVEEASKLDLRELPRAEDLPILLAARMSLSFPVLFSTVPLWAIDYTKPRSHRRFERCVFSDGGICSNFPMHLFDGLATTWPTFGIQLEELIEGRPNRIYLPKEYWQGYGDRWNHFDRKADGSSRVGGFLSAILVTMQNWNDTTLTRMPGVRDRVVRVRLDEDEGGMNLNMPDDRITKIAGYGREAAQALIEHYGEAGAPPTPGWDDQRWVRLDVLINALKQRLIGLGIALGPNVAHSTSYQQLIAASTTTTPPGHDAPLTTAQAAALTDLVQALQQLTAAFRQHSASYSHTPVPEPELRIRPPL